MAIIAAKRGAKAFFPLYSEAAGVYVVRLYRNRTMIDVVVVC